MVEVENVSTEVKERKKPGPKPKVKTESIEATEVKIDPVIIQPCVDDNIKDEPVVDPNPVISEPIISDDSKIEPINPPPVYERPVEPIRYEIMSTNGKTIPVYRNKNFRGIAIRYKGAIKILNEVEGGYKVNYMNSGFGYCIGYVKESAINAIR